MEELSHDIIRLHFEETLSLHGEALVDVLADKLERNKLKRTENLLDSLSYDVKKGEEPKLQISFKTYGRQVDRLGYKRNKHVVDINRDIWGLKENKMKKTKLRWYASMMNHDLYKLISRLSYGLGEDELARLKGILENRSQLADLGAKI